MFHLIAPSSKFAAWNDLSFIPAATQLKMNLTPMHWQEDCLGSILWTVVFLHENYCSGHVLWLALRFIAAGPGPVKLSCFL
jgi:hypothetical protein